MIRCDQVTGENGSEYLSNQLVTWAIKHKITLMYIQAGKLTQNAYMERLNRTAPHEWQDMHKFDSVAHAQNIAIKWLCTYKNERLNTKNGGVLSST